MRILFVGTGEIGVPSLVRLASESSFQVVAVLTQPDKPAGRHQQLTASPIKQAARSLGLTVLQPERVNRPESIAQIEALQPDVMVVCAYGQIFKEKLLSIAPYGCINLHASLLPRHRGASCIAAAIWQGDSVSGVTTLVMDQGLDTGPILLQEPIELAPRETAGSLHDKLAQLGPQLLVRTLCGLRDGTVQPRLQNDKEASYAPKLSRQAGQIDWRKRVVEIDRQIRALTPWPGAHTTIPPRSGGASAHFLTLKILRARPLEEKLLHASLLPGQIVSIVPAGIVVATGEGTLLLEEVQLAGRAHMPAAEFARGIRIQPGMQLGME